MDEIFSLTGPPIKGQSGIACLAETEMLLNSSAVYRTQRDKTEAIWRTPYANILFDRSRLMYRSLDSSESMFYDKVRDKSLAEHDPAKQLYHDSIRVDRQMYYTRKGYLGLGRPDIQRGDLVCIFSTAKVPYILRKLADETYILIGNT